MKNCSKCKESKSLTEFAVYKGKPHCWCRACQRTSSDSYRDRNPEKIKAYSKAWGEKNRERRIELCREWRKKNPEKVRAVNRRRWETHRESEQARSRARFLRDKYGITIPQYDAMFVAQNGVCAICSRLNLSGRRLAVDHDHATGKVRGLLCSRCNSAIGLARESLDVLKKTVLYLEKHETLASIGVI